MFAAVDADGFTDPQQLANLIGNMPPMQYVEFDPRRTKRLRDRAVITFLVGLLGALITLVGGVYVWWLIGKRQAAEEKMREQRVLAALGKMSALMAHELRNPLAAAMGQAELLEMLLPEGRTRDKAGEINRELERLEALSQNLLEFVNSRRVDAKPSDVKGMLRDVERLARSQALEVEAEDAPEVWSFDVVTFVRAVDNIVSNALSFTPDGEKVTLRLVQDGEHLVITVRDRGPGFPDDVDVFEPFVTTRVTGTGLGMAITAEIIRAHGGTIDASNHPDGGALVTISIPGEVV